MYVFLGNETSLLDFRQIFEGKSVTVAQVLQLNPTNGLLLREADGGEWWLAQPDMSCLGLLHGVADAVGAQHVCEWWQERSGTTLAVCDLSATRNAAQRTAMAAAWLCGRLLAVFDVLACENRELLNQNRRLRRSYGALQNAFSRVEHFISVNHLNRPILEYEPKRLVKFWRPEVPAGKMSQVLPVLSSRLSYFELNFQTLLTPSRGELRIVLRAEPAATILQEWTVPYREILSGWNSFSPSSVLDEPNEVVLECEWSEVAGAPAIGLSGPHWNTPYALSARPDGASFHSIGVRIWSGLPGVRPPNLPNAPSRGSKIKERVVNLSPEMFISAIQYKFAATIERDYPSVQYLKDLGRLLVHPHGQVPTIATFPSPVPEGITSASADVRTATQDAPDLEYAMALIEPEVSPEAVFTMSDGEPAIAFSGWVLVKRAEAKRLTVMLDRPAAAAVRLYLATRLPDGSEESGAWGTWGAIEIGRGTWPGKPRAAVIELPLAQQSGTMPPADRLRPDPQARDPIAVAGRGDLDLRTERPVNGPRRRQAKIEQTGDGNESGREALEVVELGEIIPSLGAEAFRRLLVSGWHAPDEDGVWGGGGESRLTFRLPNGIASANLRLQLVLMVAAAHEAEPVVADIIVNNSARSRVVFTRPQAQQIELDILNRGPTKLVDLVFRCSHPVRPVDIGLGPDERLLGVRIVRLHLAEAPLRGAPAERVASRVVTLD